ncbi:MAG: hypothetical protein IKS10_00185 [Lachnospiraceae bacterium]|nr:hypothetical protein [Lachnospiraceae bacterium]
MLKKQPGEPKWAYWWPLRQRKPEEYGGKATRGEENGFLVAVALMEY